MIVRNAADFSLICERLVLNDPRTICVDLTRNDGHGLQLNDRQARTLADSLQNNTNVKHIHLNVEGMSVRGAATLMGFIISSHQLGELTLQGCADLDPEEFPNQALAVHVLAGASLRNLGSICLNLDSCHIARSTLLLIFGNTSHLSEFSMINPSILIVDDGDPILDEMPFSRTLKSVDILWGGSDVEIEESLPDLVLKCSARLSNLISIGIKNAPEDIPLELLLNSKSLKEMRYHGHAAVKRHYSIVNFLQGTDSLDTLLLDFFLSSKQKDELSNVIANNYSLVSIEQDICPKIDYYCSRNRKFLDRWQDVSFILPYEVWPWAIVTACCSERGRSALWHRLPMMISSLPSIIHNSYHNDANLAFRSSDRETINAREDSAGSLIKFDANEMTHKKVFLLDV